MTKDSGEGLHEKKQADEAETEAECRILNRRVKTAKDAHGSHGEAGDERQHENQSNAPHFLGDLRVFDFCKCGDTGGEHVIHHGPGGSDAMICPLAGAGSRD